MGPGLTVGIRIPQVETGPPLSTRPGCAVDKQISIWIPYQNVAGVKLIDPKGTIMAEKAKIATTIRMVPTGGTTTKGTTINQSKRFQGSKAQA